MGVGITNRKIPGADVTCLPGHVSLLFISFCSYFKRAPFFFFLFCFIFSTSFLAFESFPMSLSAAAKELGLKCALQVLLLFSPGTFDQM